MTSISELSFKYFQKSYLEVSDTTDIKLYDLVNTKCKNIVNYGPYNNVYEFVKITYYEYIIISMNYKDLIKFINNKNFDELEYIYVLHELFKIKSDVTTFDSIYFHKIKLFLDKFINTIYNKFYNKFIMEELSKCNFITLENEQKWKEYFSIKSDINSKEKQNIIIKDTNEINEVLIKDTDNIESCGGDGIRSVEGNVEDDDEDYNAHFCDM